MIKFKKIVCLLISASILVFQVSATRVQRNEEETEVARSPHTSPPSRIIITNYTVSGGGLIAGEVSTVEITLRNTGLWVGVSSVILTGSIEAAAPVEFARTNQAFVARIPPGGETTIEIEYFTKNVDLTALRSVSVSFVIGYEDESIGIERFLNVSMRLPVLRGARTTVDEDDMRWSEPHTRRRAQLLNSRLMQAAYAGGIVFFGLWIIIILLFKLGIFRRRA